MHAPLDAVRISIVQVLQSARGRFGDRVISVYDVHMRRDFRDEHLSTRSRSRRPFYVLLCAIFVVALGVAWWLKTQNDAVEAHNLALIKKTESLDLAVKKLKLRLENEKKAREEAAAKAKAASDAALAQGIVPPPSRTPSAAGGPHTDPSKIDVVVNKKHPITPLAYTPAVATVDCAGGGSATISTQAVSDFIAMCQAAVAAGIPLGVSSSYRSYATQISTYNYWVGQSGVAGADTYSARPGYSEHQTGLAIDFRVPGGAALSEFTGTPQQLWLAAHAPSYGFIQRYTPENTQATGYNAESWHYRYIGKAYAGNYASTNPGSLEQFWGIPGGLY